MGQIFHACAYDTELMTCCVYDADKFHANCFSFCGTVYSMHYLLRQKPYRVMWGGYSALSDNNFAGFSRDEDLHGLSTYIDEEFLEMNSDNFKSVSADKIKFIGENNKLWKNMDVWDEAIQYFDAKKNHSVRYSGYLLNHTQKMAVNLADYHERSKYLSKDGIEMSIDVVPVLTETGNGAQMALFDGISAETTENLFGKWCGDLLQIVEKLPEDYQLIDCCFAGIWERAKYCYRKFGINENRNLLKDSSGNLYEVAKLNFFEKRGSVSYVRVEDTEKGVRFVTESKI